MRWVQLLESALDVVEEHAEGMGDLLVRVGALRRGGSRLFLHCLAEHVIDELGGQPGRL